MTRAELKEICLSLAASSSDFPFDFETEVFRVQGKIFALSGISASGVAGQVFTVNLKCDPQLAVELRREFPDIVPGFHMNKTHWNTIYVNRALPDERVRWLISHSWEMVVRGLPRKIRDNLISNER